jgi:hypothetical protein
LVVRGYEKGEGEGDGPSEPQAKVSLMGGKGVAKRMNVIFIVDVGR